MGRIVLLVLVAALTARCSNTESQGFSTKAPQTDSELGYIVTAEQSEISTLQKNHSSAMVRLVSPTLGLYEVSGLDLNTLKQSLKNQDIQKNFFMKSTHAPRTWSMNKMANNTSPDAMSALETCQRSPTAPDVGFDVEKSNFRTSITLGESVTLVALGSAHKDIGGDVRFMWDMLPPEFSKQGFERGIADTQTITPDSVGLYQIALIAQGADSSCAATVVQLMVTDNPALDASIEMASAPDSSLFTHLDIVKARQAWTQARGQGVVVAVVDSGINYNHPSIRERLVMKTAEQEASDNNGFAGDTLGWDFINGDNLPFDDAGHGTHVSGLIASSLAGVAPDSKILPIKVLNAAGSGDLASIVGGIMYAVDNNAQIINVSLGFEIPFAPMPLIAALRAAREKNIVVFIAAGNGDPMTGIGFDISLRPYQPASIQDDNLITIASTDEHNALTTYSNFSDKLVHLASPGGSPTMPLVSLATMNPEKVALSGQMGTSMASPVAAGVAALVLSANPQLKAQEVKTILLETGDSVAALSGKVSSGKIVNAQAAVQRALDFHPENVMN